MPLFYQESVVQTAFAEITTTTSTTSLTHVDLLTLTITTGANPLLIYVSMSSENSAANGWVEAQLIVSGVVSAGTAYHSTSSGFGNTGSIVWKTPPLTAGSQLIRLQWHVGALIGGSATITPSNGVNHATLYVQEVTV